ncbi:MAG: hypothetical protein SNJ74_06855 [Fimbriimonadaceae bacterium]
MALSNVPTPARRGVLGLIVAAALVVAVGCGSPAWQEAREQGEKALQNSKAALNAVHRAALEDASKLGVESPTASLEAARTALTDVQSQIAGVPLPAGTREWWDQNVSAQIAKIDAALNLQEVRSQWQALAGQANTATAGTKANLEAELARMRESNPGFQAIDDKLKAAEQAYRDAVRRAADAFRAPSPETP